MAQRRSAYPGAVTRACLVLIDSPSATEPDDRVPASALRALPVDAPAFTAEELGLTRGDGVFETAAGTRQRPVRLTAQQPDPAPMMWA